MGVNPGFAAQGHTLVDPGRVRNLNDDFSAQINAFRAANAAIVVRVSDVTDGDAVASAIAGTDLDKMVGKITRNDEGLPPFAASNVCKAPLVGGQWRLKDDGTSDLVSVDNKTAPA